MPPANKGKGRATQSPAKQVHSITSFFTSFQQPASSSRRPDGSPPAKKLKRSDPITIIDSDDDIIQDAPSSVHTSPPKQSPPKPSLTKVELNSDLWIDQYAPSNVETLCVHPKKVASVKGWLTEAFSNSPLAKYRRILILSGPAGSGKTATIRALQKELDYEIIEYRASEALGEQSLVTQFAAFLSRASTMPSLTFQKPVHVPSSTGKKLVLLEDLPNIFTSPQTKASFHAALINYATSDRIKPGMPLVIIVSESVARPGTEDSFSDIKSSDSFGLRTVVPPQVQRAQVTMEIKFNAVAVTLLRKALNTLLDIVYEKNAKAKPSKEAVEAVVQGCNGDVRSAINSLQFVVGDGAAVLKASVTAKKKSQKKGTTKKDEAAALVHLATARETSLFLFHALGKVLFCKRWGQDPDEDKKEEKNSKRTRPPKPDPLPSHLKQHRRRLPKTDVNILFADAPVDSQLFTAYIHQNYIPFTDDIEQCSAILDYTSFSDSLLKLENDYGFIPITSSYAFHNTVLGTMHSLPDPVARKGQTMHKAEIWENARKTRTNWEDIVEFAGSNSVAKNSAATEFVPYLSKVAIQVPKHLKELAEFPPLRKVALQRLEEGLVDDEYEESPPQIPSPNQRKEEPKKEEEDTFLSDDDIEEI